MKLQFTLDVSPPRTKKTSSRIVRFGKNKEFIKILPSEAFQQWFHDAMVLEPHIRNLALYNGIKLPLTNNVHVTALFYRDAYTGDLLGYEQALADWLQSPVIRWYDHGNHVPAKGRNDAQMKALGYLPKKVRDGAGIVVDDKQITSWDGSRLAKDEARPRIEVCIETVGEAQASLLEDLEEMDA